MTSKNLIIQKIDNFYTFITKFSLFVFIRNYENRLKEKILIETVSKLLEDKGASYSISKNSVSWMAGEGASFPITRQHYKYKNIEVVISDSLYISLKQVYFDYGRTNTFIFDNKDFSSDNLSAKMLTLQQLNELKNILNK